MRRWGRETRKFVPNELIPKLTFRGLVLRSDQYSWSWLRTREKTWPVWEEACRVSSLELRSKKRELNCRKLYHFVKLRTDAFFLVHSYCSRGEKKYKILSILLWTSQATYRILVSFFVVENRKLTFRYPGQTDKLYWVSSKYKQKKRAANFTWV